jgi:hypothetical protein
LQVEVEEKVVAQTQQHQVEVLHVITETLVVIHLVQVAVVEHKLRVEMVERLGQEHLLVVKQELWVRVEMVDFGKQLQVEVVAEVVLVEVEVEMMVVAQVQTAVEEVELVHH